MSHRNRLFAVINALVVLVVIAWNYWTAAYGLNGRTVGGMSDRYDTLFTPASYAFSIWGLIFLGLLINAAYQLWVTFMNKDASSDPDTHQHRTAFVERLGPWLILTNIANALWTLFWLNEYTAVSVVVLSAMCAFLVVAMRKLDMETWDAPREVIVFVWWPIVIYAGWVSVAVLANLSAFLAKHDIVSGDSAAWAVSMIAVATVYNVLAVRFRNLREHALVAVWAFVAIAVAQRDGNPTVHWSAVGAAALLAFAVGLHAFINRHTLPFFART